MWEIEVKFLGEECLPFSYSYKVTLRVTGSLKFRGREDMSFTVSIHGISCLWHHLQGLRRLLGRKKWHQLPGCFSSAQGFSLISLEKVQVLKWSEKGQSKIKVRVRWMVEGISSTEVCLQETPLCTSGRALEVRLDGAVRFSLLEMGREFLIE